MKKKVIIILIVIALSVISVIVGITIKNKNSNPTQNLNNEIEEVIVVNQNNEQDGKVDIIDVNSKSRPFAISVNNTPVAVKVQTGLNKAYLVYEIPTEGNTSRLLALYKDIEEDTKIGTIRSARHNLIDYALESDAIFVHYGWSHYAEDDEKKGVINYINGLFDTPFWRENPEKLPSEHTAYTSIEKLKDTVIAKKFKTESDDTILLNYNYGDVDLSSEQEAIKANKIIIPYGSEPNITSFEYDNDKKMYNRIENNNNCIDYETKENISTKNIIVQKVNYEVCSDNYYWNLKNIGEGTGYFITNGYAVPIKWKKGSRAGKTKYYYKNGKEIEVSDGRTYIEIQTTKQNLDIN